MSTCRASVTRPISRPPATTAASLKISCRKDSTNEEPPLTGFLIGIAVAVIAAAMIVRNYQPQTVLLLAGLILLVLAAVLFPEHPILEQKAKSTGWKGFDVLAVVRDSLITQMSGI